MFPTGLLTPEAVAGLALLAFLPRAKGQPVEDQLEVGFGWLAWTLMLPEQQWQPLRKHSTGLFLVCSLSHGSGRSSHERLLRSMC